MVLSSAHFGSIKVITGNIVLFSSAGTQIILQLKLEFLFKKKCGWERMLVSSWLKLVAAEGGRNGIFPECWGLFGCPGSRVDVLAGQRGEPELAGLLQPCAQVPGAQRWK